MDRNDDAVLQDDFFLGERRNLFLQHQRHVEER